MRNRKAIILFVTCFFLSPGFSQQVRRTDDPILFRGVVIGASNQSRLANSQIHINSFFSYNGTTAQQRLTYLNYKTGSYLDCFVPCTVRPASFVVRPSYPL